VPLCQLEKGYALRPKVEKATQPEGTEQENRGRKRDQVGGKGAKKKLKREVKGNDGAEADEDANDAGGPDLEATISEAVSAAVKSELGKALATLQHGSQAAMPLSQPSSMFSGGLQVAQQQQPPSLQSHLLQIQNPQLQQYQQFLEFQQFQRQHPQQP
jgi:hypothetical protein